MVEVDYNILFASSNDVKLSEVRAITKEFNEKLFNPKGINIVIKSLSDVKISTFDNPEETGETYLENAKIKANFYGSWLKGEPVRAILADDGGYEVADWNYLPGIHTHRLIDIYTLDRLQDASKAFQCCAMYMTVDNKWVLDANHRVPGTMVREKRGDYGSYYMNSFIPNNQSSLNIERKTFAELGFDYICKYSARAFCLSEIYAMLLDTF